MIQFAANCAIVVGMLIAALVCALLFSDLGFAEKLGALAERHQFSYVQSAFLASLVFAPLLFLLGLFGGYAFRGNQRLTWVLIFCLALCFLMLPQLRETRFHANPSLWSYSLLAVLLTLPALLGGMAWKSLEKQ